MDILRVIQFIEQERLAKNIRKITLCGACDITTQYYDKLLKGGSKPGYEIIDNLMREIGYDLAPIRRI